MKPKSLFVVVLCLLFGATAAWAQESAHPHQPSTTSAESLIYSVDRSPERTFDTSRAVEVITAEEIWRSGAMTLADLLTEVPGFSMQQTNFSGGAPIVRGLLGKQVLIMIDGVKLNNATWRNASKEYLNIIDLTQVERIEIVRGVVSVLGTESLGGVINIITRKGPSDDSAIAGTIGAQYASASDSFRIPVLVQGQGKGYRFSAGASFHNAGDFQGGGDFGTEPLSDYTDGGFHGSLQLLLSADKTLSFRYQNFEQNDVNRADAIADGTNLSFVDTPITLQLGSISYQDLTSRPWADSFSATAYWNRQQDGREEIRTRTPNVKSILGDEDTAIGGSLEIGKFIGAHHLVYGIDYSHDEITSTRHDYRVSDGADLGQERGRFTDGAHYETMGFYVNDRFSITRWVTATAGVRYGTFSSSGEEDSRFGVISVDSDNSDITGAVNVVVHATSNLNLIANAIRGFRAPNLDDISKFSERRDGIEVPNPNVEAEHIDSYELGVKYESAKFGATAFWYHNDLENLLMRSSGTFGGSTFHDANGNGVQDANELPFLQSKNIGEAEITGLELGVHYAPVEWLLIRGNYSRTTGDDVTANEPLRRIPPAFGTASVRWRSAQAYRPWAELVYEFASAQTRLAQGDIDDPRIGADGTPAYNVFTLRGGFDVNERIRVTGGVENLTDEAYKYHASFAYRPGRQFVLGTQFKF